MNQFRENKNSGYLVVTKNGLKGRTYHTDINCSENRIPVYLEDGRKILCKAETLKLTGFIEVALTVVVRS